MHHWSSREVHDNLCDQVESAAEPRPEELIMGPTLGPKVKGLNAGWAPMLGPLAEIWVMALLFNDRALVIVLVAVLSVLLQSHPGM